MKKCTVCQFNAKKSQIISLLWTWAPCAQAQQAKHPNRTTLHAPPPPPLVLLGFHLHCIWSSLKVGSPCYLIKIMYCCYNQTCLTWHLCWQTQNTGKCPNDGNSGTNGQQRPEVITVSLCWIEKCFWQLQCWVFLSASPVSSDRLRHDAAKC